MFITTLSPNPLQLSDLMQNFKDTSSNSNSTSTMSRNNLDEENMDINSSSQERGDGMSLQSNGDQDPDPDQEPPFAFSISAQSLDRLQHILQDLQEEFESQLDVFEEKEERVRRYKSQMLASDFKDRYKEQLSPQISARKSNPNVHIRSSNNIPSSSSASVSTRASDQPISTISSKSSENVQKPRPTTDYFKFKPEQHQLLDDLTKEMMSKFNNKTDDEEDEIEDEGEKRRSNHSQIHNQNQNQNHGHGNSNRQSVSSSTHQDSDAEASELSPVIQSPLVKVGAGSPREEIRRSMVEKWKEIKELEKELEKNRDHLQKRFTQIQKLEDEIENMNFYLKKSRAQDNSHHHTSVYQPHNSSNFSTGSNENEFNLSVASHENEEDRSSECESSNTGFLQSQSENRPVSPAKVQPQFSGDPVITIEESSHLFSPSDPLLAGETGTTSVKITMTPSGSNTRDERNLEENKSSPALDEDSLKITRMGWISCFALNFFVLIITVIILVVTAYT